MSNSSMTRTDQARPAPSKRRGSSASTTLPLIVKILGLGTAIGVAAALTPTLLAQSSWGFLAILWGLVLALVATYATGRGLPAKYLVPGVVLLILMVVFPIVMTARLSTTNFGDGARVSKSETVQSIIAGSVVQEPGSPTYNLSVGRAGIGQYALFLVDPATGQVQVGTEEGLAPAPDASVENGFVTDAADYTILSPIEANRASEQVQQLLVPTDGGTIRTFGVSEAFEAQAQLVHDEDADTITDRSSGTVYSVASDGDREYFVDPEGNRLSDQSWMSDVGFANYARIFTDPQITRDFFGIFVWTFVFATISVVFNFALGLFLAVTFNDERVKGQRIYRALLILPYAIPGFISILIWSGFFNTDFGLINQLTGLEVNWFGNPTTAKFAVILTNLWMGFPYMFLVCTGALQSIPGDLKEAASIDGASGFYGFRKITFPLLLVSVAPLLVATFAFNFNNYNIIQLLTLGGPFTVDNPTAGGTDILISYIMRLAFGAGGAQIGFASAVSVVLFVLTGVIAAIQFQATRRLEDVN